MKTFIRLFLFTFLVLLVLAPAAAAQSPYPSLSFARQSNKESTTDYLLKPETDEIHKRIGGADKPYRIVGALVRPAKQLGVLLFVNVQKEFQLVPQVDKSVVITVDKVELNKLSYEIGGTDESATGRVEIGNILMKLDDIRRVAKGNSVSMKLGVVVHQLDRDNIAALRYLVEQIDQDAKAVK